jgi:hypothetical protein
MPLVQTRGAASAQGFGEFSQPAVAANYIEDVFSTYLYTGNGPTGQSINNGIDLATKGGLLWCKNRTTGSTPHYLFDTTRSFSYTYASSLDSASTNAETGHGTDYAKPETNGFSFGTGAGSTSPNKSGDNFASWTFREQAKFFDVVTYTGNSTNRTIAHNLGSAPGMIIVKSTTQVSNWQVYHRSLTSAAYAIQLNSTAAEASFPTAWNSTAPTSTEFSIGTSSSVNLSGETFVAYLFAHNAGGFGTAGTDNVISCGSFTVSAGGTASVNLGYEPQWVMVKASSRVLDWTIQDTMRGMYGVTGISPLDLYPNLSSAEANGNQAPINATGFTWSGYANETFVYVAIRRPMKVPTTGTSVFTPINVSSSGDFTSTAGFPVDLIVYGSKTASDKWYWFDRLRGTGNLDSATTAAEATGYPTDFASNTKFSQTGITGDFSSYISYDFSRRPGFFDEVCYTGTGSNTTQSHNLGVVPELIIVKSRSSNPGANWVVWNTTLNSSTGYLYLNADMAASNFAGVWNGAPTSSYFTLGNNFQNNGSGVTFVAYLFATCAGVSKVGSYTGNGGTQAIACGFTGGARFVLIKRTDSTGDWYVYDTVRGMTLLTDPYLFLNSTAVQAATLGSVTTTTGGFTVDATVLAAINTNAASYIFLAIA